MLIHSDKEHKLTHEDRVKGGKSRSRAKVIASKINPRKKCSPACPIYPCLFQPLSKSRFNGKCALKEMPPKIQKRAVDIFLKGEEGLSSQILNLLFSLSYGFENLETEEKRKVLEDFIKVKKSIYGEKKKIDIKENPFEKIIDNLFE